MNYWTKCSFLCPKSGVRIHFIYGDTFVWVISFFYICPMGIMKYNRCRHLAPYNFFLLNSDFHCRNVRALITVRTVFLLEISSNLKNKMHIQWKKLGSNYIITWFLCSHIYLRFEMTRPKSSLLSKTVWSLCTEIHYLSKHSNTWLLKIAVNITLFLCALKLL